MWRRSPRIDRKPTGRQTPIRAPRMGESLAIGLGCDRTPPGRRRRAGRTVTPDDGPLERDGLQQR